MLKPKIPQSLFFVSGSYLYDRIVPQDHPVSSTGQALLRRMNAVVDFSFVKDLVRDMYTPDFGRPDRRP